MKLSQPAFAANTSITYVKNVKKKKKRSKKHTNNKKTKQKQKINKRSQGQTQYLAGMHNVCLQTRGDKGPETGGGSGSIIQEEVEYCVHFFCPRYSVYVSPLIFCYNLTKASWGGPLQSTKVSVQRGPIYTTRHAKTNSLPVFIPRTVQTTGSWWRGLTLTLIP